MRVLGDPCIADGTADTHVRQRSPVCAGPAVLRRERLAPRLSARASWSGELTPAGLSERAERDEAG